MSNQSWHYTPFLKLKQNEIMAIRELDNTSKSKIIPFFDFPKGNDKDFDNFRNFGRVRARQIERNLGENFKCYLDTFDALEFNEGGLRSYYYLLNEFSKSKIIPVIGLNRSDDHKLSIVQAVFEMKVSQEILALRLQFEDIESFSAVKPEIDEVLNGLIGSFNNLELIIDLRICSGMKNIAGVATKVNTFCNEFIKTYKTSKIILTGSSITSVVTDMCSPNSQNTLERLEVDVFLAVRSIYNLNTLFSFGDYTVVSPNFIEVDIPPNLMRHRTVSKLIYSFDRSHHIWRGTTLHLEGEKQYNAHVKDLISKSFYRKPGYSWADSEFYNKQDQTSGFSANSMIKHVVNAHLEYMIKNGL